MFDDFFDPIPGVTTHVFLLTSQPDLTVKAELIRNPDDKRLSSKKAFAVIAVDTLVLTDDEFAAAGDHADRLVEGIGQADILKPRIANSLGGISPFFNVLTDVTGDVTLKLVEFGPTGAEWKVVSSEI